MASLLTKISWERLRKRENKKNKKKIVPMSSCLTRNRKFKKIAKKFKNLKNTIIASFQAKISWERPRKRENKIRSDEFLPDPQ